jgi:hypothetical protein
MKKKLFLIGAVFMVLAAAAFAQNEADFETDGNGTITKYVGWDTKIVIPANIGGKPVSAIGEAAFSKLELTSITIPNTVKTIGASAFSNNKLTNVVIPEGVTSIGTNAFSGNSITTVTLGANVRGNLSTAGLAYNIFCDYISNNRKAGAYTYRQKDSTEWRYNNGTRRTEDGFTYIQTQYGIIIASYNGSGVNALRIPESINKLPVRAILNLSNRNITRVQIPNSVTYIGEEAFYENNLTSITIPDSVTSIGSSAFFGNKLTSVTIGNSVTYIGNSAFGSYYGENQLTSVTIPDSVTYIGSKAFFENKLTSVTIGNSVTSIGSEAFSSNKLTSVTIPDSVTSIGSSAFRGNQLTSVTIPDSVTSIGSGAFSGNILS